MKSKGKKPTLRLSQIKPFATKIGTLHNGEVKIYKDANTKGIGFYFIFSKHGYALCRTFVAPQKTKTGFDTTIKRIELCKTAPMEQVFNKSFNVDACVIYFVDAYDLDDMIDEVLYDGDPTSYSGDFQNYTEISFELSDKYRFLCQKY